MWNTWPRLFSRREVTADTQALFFFVCLVCVTAYIKMTTIGVKPAPKERTLPLNVPSYVYNYPSTQKVQLAAVKTGLFHPNLPSFRRMDMDTAGHKLPDEHCRTTTSAGPGRHWYSEIFFRLERVCFQSHCLFMEVLNILTKLELAIHATTCSCPKERLLFCNKTYKPCMDLIGPWPCFSLYFLD